MGRNMFGPIRGDWTPTRTETTGRAGGATTRRTTTRCSCSRTTLARPITMDGGTTFNFVDDRDRVGARAGVRRRRREGRASRRRRVDDPAVPARWAWSTNCTLRSCRCCSAAVNGCSTPSATPWTATNAPSSSAPSGWPTSSSPGQGNSEHRASRPKKTGVRALLTPEMANRGEPSEFEDWYADHYRRLVATMYFVSGDRTGAKEAVDEACARAFERWSARPRHAVTGRLDADGRA